MKRTLVLNNNYAPLGTVNWQRAVILLFQNKAELIETFEDVIHTTNRTYPMPAVIKVSTYIKARSVGVRFNKENVFLRDKGKCQYCLKKLVSKLATFDHVIPKSKGGKTQWNNIVTSCYDCNQFKSNKMPEEAGMKLLTKPIKPTPSSMNMTFKMTNSSIPESWKKYLW